MSGIIEKIALLGREFTIQTEYVPGPDAKIRTMAYDGGRLVTVRESGAGPADASAGRIDERVREHHRLITDNLYKRAAELQAVKGLTTERPIRESPAPQQAAPTAKRRPMPAIEPGSRLERSIATRRAVGPFSLAFARPAPPDCEELDTSLEAAEVSIDGIMGAPVFHQLRLDEQLTFIALRGQLATWRLSEKNPSVAVEVWSNIEPFARHLQRINDRRELVAFDHELLTWAMSELGQGVVSDRLLEGLQALAGRDAQLDHVLAHSAETTVQALLEVLMGLLDRTLV